MTSSIKQGTRALGCAIAEDSGADIRLGRPASAIVDDGDAVTAIVGPHEAVSAAAAIVMVPISALPQISLTPALAGAQRQAVEHGQVSSGLKLWIRVRPDPGPWFSVAAAPSPLQILHRDMALPDDDALLHGFGSDHTLLDGNDRDAVQAVLARVLPSAEVLETASHDWVADPYSRETWPHSTQGNFVSDFTAMRSPQPESSPANRAASRSRSR